MSTQSVSTSSDTSESTSIVTIRTMTTSSDTSLTTLVLNTSLVVTNTGISQSSSIILAASSTLTDSSTSILSSDTTSSIADSCIIISPLCTEIVGSELGSNRFNNYTYYTYLFTPGENCTCAEITFAFVDGYGYLDDVSITSTNDSEEMIKNG
ncbi:unnamed protein product, partial [Didymodactylos carnosus]